MSTDANGTQVPNPNPEEKEPVLDEQGNPVDQGNDPLDAITDPKQAIAEAKKFRAIAGRKAKKEPAAPVAPAPTPTPAPTSNFVTKDDMAKKATKDAKKMAPKEVQDNWDDLMDIPLGGYDPLDPDSIVENMTNRLAILNKNKKPEDGKPDMSDVTTTKATASGTTGGKPPAPQAGLPRFTSPKQPSDWYKKP